MPDLIIFDEEEGVALRRPFRLEGQQPAQNIRLQRLRGPVGTISWITPFLGRWNTNGGVLTFTESGGFLHGRIERSDANGAPAMIRRLLFTRTEDGRVIGAWARSVGFDGAEATINLSADGQSVHGRFSQLMGPGETWSARRLGATPSPAEPPPPVPVPAPPSGPTAPDPAAPPRPGAFQPLGGFEVGFDRLERPRDEGIVRAVVTLRNATAQVQHLPSGTFRAILTDADGAGQERNQLWRGSGEPAQLFSGTPALQPGRELTVRFTFNPDIRELDSLVLMRGTDQVEFDLEGQ